MEEELISIAYKDEIITKVSARRFIHSSNKFMKLIREEGYKDRIDFDDPFSRDSVTQVFKVVSKEEPNITVSNAPECLLICKEWEMIPKINKCFQDFMEQNDKNVFIPDLILKIKQNQDVNEETDKLKNKLLDYIEDPNLISIELKILKKIINFENYEPNSEDFHKVFNFCLKYIDEHRDDKSSSKIFKTLINPSPEEKYELEKRPYFNRLVIDDSTTRAIIGAYDKNEQIPKKNLELFEQKYPRSKELYQYFLSEMDEKMRIRQNDTKLSIAKPPLFYIDWKSETKFNENNTVTLSFDCWLFAYCGTSGQTSPSFIKVNNSKQINISGCSSGYGYSSITFPLHKGTQITNNVGSYNSATMNYYKFKNDNKIVSLPAYNDLQLKLWGTKYIVDRDGWLYACSGSCQTSGYVEINGSINIYFSQHTSSYNSFGSTLIPLSKGDSFTANQGGDPYPLFFIPGIERTQTGFPDWSKEEIQAWNSENVATRNGWIYAHCISYCCHSNGAQQSPAILKSNGWCSLWIW